MRWISRGRSRAGREERIAQCGWLTVVVAFALGVGILVVAYTGHPNNLANLASPGLIFLAAYPVWLGCVAYRGSLASSGYVQMGSLFGAAAGFAVLAYVFGFSIGPAFLIVLAFSLAGAGYVFSSQSWGTRVLLVLAAAAGAGVSIAIFSIGYILTGIK